MFTKLSRLSSLNLKLFSNLFLKRKINTKTSNLFSDLLSNGSVIYSESQDIFVNLSLEDWIYRNIDLKNKKILVLWRNGPSVVIGRHQNPWTECHLRRCHEHNVCVVRRNSGGGTVYHDLNNLNLSFICDKKLYNRKNNLILIRNVLSDKFGIDSKITEREDLVLSQSGHKISGTASKVGAHNSYHHLTLLIDADMDQMRRFIRKESKLIKSKATESIRSTTANLKSINSCIQSEDVLKEIALAFKTQQNVNNVVPKSPFIELEVNPNIFNGIKDIENTFRSWDWIYGKTPRFTVNQKFIWKNICCQLEIDVFHGIIEKLVITQLKSNLNLNGIKFTEESVSHYLNAFLTKSLSNYEFERYLCDYIKKCVEQTF